jgi:hypothetical protein
MTFAAPLFLIAALAGIIPLVLHMINRQKAVQAPFPTLRFLQISVRKTRRRKQIHDLLLLLLRVALLLLLAAGLAKPTLSSLRTLLGGAQSAVVLVLDNSASMGTIDRGQPRLDTALAAAGQVLDELGDGDLVGLLVSGGPPLAESGRLDRTQEKVRQMLGQCRVSYQRADLGSCVRQARDLLVKSDAPNKLIYVLTDNQKLSWENSPLPARAGQGSSVPAQPAGPKSPAATPMASPPDDQAADITLVVVDCNRAAEPDVAVQGLDLDAALPVAGVPIKADVQLLNASPIAQQRLVELVLDGVKEQTSPVLSLPPGGLGKHQFSFSFDRGGLHRGEVRLVGQDGSKYDDRRFFGLDVDQGIPVAVVKTKRQEIPYLEDTFYVERALQPGKPGGDWALRVTSLVADDLSAEPLDKYKVVFCVNLPAPGEEIARRLRDYVAGGGNLVWMCGDNVAPEAYNQMNRAAGGELLPAPLADVRAARGQAGRDSWHVNFLDRRHPALARLVEPPALYESILVYQYVSMDVAAAPDAWVLARLDDGQPLLAQRSVGEGKVLLLGAGAQVGWSNLPLRPIFPPLLVGLTFDLAGAEMSGRQTLAGTPLVWQLPDEPRPVAVEVLRPDGETVRLPTEAAKDVRPAGAGPKQAGQQAANGQKAPKGQVFRYADTYEIGVYTLRLLDAVHPRQIAWAVNFDPQEADPTKIEREELQRRLAPMRLVVADNPEDLSGTFAALREGRSLWMPLLAAVLAMLVLETLLANRLGPKRIASPG